MFRNLRGVQSLLGTTGLIALVKSKITKSNIIFSVQPDFLSHSVQLRIPSTDIPTYKKVFKDFEYDFDTAHEPKCIVDAGANIGLATVLFAHRFPSAKIISIEPEINNFNLLKKNVAPYKNVIPINAALWDKNEEIALIDPGWGEWGFMTSNVCPPEEKRCINSNKVVAMTIDRILYDHALKHIDILKIDIEGAEKEVFADTTAWINNVSSIIIELHDRGKIGCNRSFYNGTNGFDTEWRQGENIYLARDNYLERTK